MREAIKTKYCFKAFVNDFGTILKANVYTILGTIFRKRAVREAAASEAVCRLPAPLGNGAPRG